MSHERSLSRAAQVALDDVLHRFREHVLRGARLRAAKRGGSHSYDVFDTDIFESAAWLWDADADGPSSWSETHRLRDDQRLSAREFERGRVRYRIGELLRIYLVGGLVIAAAAGLYLGIRAAMSLFDESVEVWAAALAGAGLIMSIVSYLLLRIFERRAAYTWVGSEVRGDLTEYVLYQWEQIERLARAAAASHLGTDPYDEPIIKVIDHLVETGRLQDEDIIAFTYLANLRNRVAHEGELLSERELALAGAYAERLIDKLSDIPRDAVQADRAYGEDRPQPT